MDNAQKAIMIGVGLFITIIIISAVLLVVTMGSDLMGGATSELGSISGVLKSQILDGFDGKTKSGSEILAAVRQYSNSDSVAMILTQDSKNYYVGAGVITLPEGTEADKNNYKSGGITDGDIDEFKIDVANAPQKSTYNDLTNVIPATKYYKTAVVYDTAGNAIGIAAIQIK